MGVGGIMRAVLSYRNHLRIKRAWHVPRNVPWLSRRDHRREALRQDVARLRMNHKLRRLAFVRTYSPIMLELMSIHTAIHLASWAHLKSFFLNSSFHNHGRHFCDKNTNGFHWKRIAGKASLVSDQTSQEGGRRQDMERHFDGFMRFDGARPVSYWSLENHSDCAWALPSDVTRDFRTHRALPWRFVA